MVKYKASVRVNGSLKLASETPPKTKYGKQQQNQWGARRKGPDALQRWICCPDDRADLERDQSDQCQKPECKYPDGHTDRSAVQRQQIVDRNECDG